MRRKIILAGWLVGIVWFGVAHAGTAVFDFGGTKATLTTTVDQDVVLNSLLVRENANRAARTPPDPSISLEEYTKQILTATLAGYQVQSGTLEQKDACAAYKLLVKGSQDQIKTALSGYSPCP